LKPFIAGSLKMNRIEFRDRAVAASLKHLHWKRQPARSRQFRDRAVAASLKLEFYDEPRTRMPAIPRPRGRGLIEAFNILSTLPTRWEFRDRAVAASLKHFGVRAIDHAHHQFRDRAVAASLKQYGARVDVTEDFQFRDRAVAASLKHRDSAHAVPRFDNSATARSRPH